MGRTRNPDKLIDIAERDRRIIQLRRNGWHWADIATDVDLSMSRCHQIVNEHLKNIPQSAANAWREEELDLLGRGIRKLLLIAEDDRVDNSGRPIVSPHARAEAWREVRMHSESRRKMLGIDAPVKRELEVIDSSDAALRAEITELENEQRAWEANR